MHFRHALKCRAGVRGSVRVDADFLSFVKGLLKDPVSLFKAFNHSYPFFKDPILPIFFINGCLKNPAILFC